MPSVSVFEHLDMEINDELAEITLDRPAVHNAFDTAMVLDLRRAFDTIALEPAVDVVVISGAGDEAFSSGADITEYAGPADEQATEQAVRQKLFFEMCRAPFDCQAPVIAKIDGFCIGGGLILASYCDIRIASADSSFGIGTTDIGQIPTAGFAWRAINLIGEAKAKELVYSARYIDAREAERIGLVNRTVPADELDSAVATMVRDIRNTGTQAIKQSKKVLNRTVSTPSLEEARKFEADAWMEQFRTDERQRLVDEFLDE